MTHGIKKETYVYADEKTARALTFDLLNKIYENVEDMKECHHRHLETCGKRFKKLEDRRKKDTAIASASGFGGGFMAMALYYLKEWMSKFNI